ncbi:hypothetical protein BJ508DRAFT_314696 [Ascobolus immersus RN42]|uniref:Uncharacterized protein n=1 Tax=Ascobolus immersus RN42 TaxID=1160509 RepID=A0A3N4HE43_ASCIM|nr:hypothetical protein BJ508DRAFT_314696 [Ascobolus immersus RN42]
MLSRLYQSFSFSTIEFTRIHGGCMQICRQFLRRCHDFDCKESNNSSFVCHTLATSRRFGRQAFDHVHTRCRPSTLLQDVLLSYRRSTGSTICGLLLGIKHSTECTRAVACPPPVSQATPCCWEASFRSGALVLSLVFLQVYQPRPAELHARDRVHLTCCSSWLTSVELQAFDRVHELAVSFGLGVRTLEEDIGESSLMSVTSSVSLNLFGSYSRTGWHRRLYHHETIGGFPQLLNPVLAFSQLLNAYEEVKEKRRILVDPEDEENIWTLRWMKCKAKRGIYEPIVGDGFGATEDGKDKTRMRMGWKSRFGMIARISETEPMEIAENGVTFGGLGVLSSTTIITSSLLEVRFLNGH